MAITRPVSSAIRRSTIALPLSTVLRRDDFFFSPTFDNHVQGLVPVFACCFQILLLSFFFWGYFPWHTGGGLLVGVGVLGAMSV